MGIYRDYIPGTQTNDPSFGWLTFNFMGQNLENKGHNWVPGIYLYMILLDLT